MIHNIRDQSPNNAIIYINFLQCYYLLNSIFLPIIFRYEIEKYIETYYKHTIYLFSLKSILSKKRSLTYAHRCLGRTSKFLLNKTQKYLLNTFMN